MSPTGDHHRRRPGRKLDAGNAGRSSIRSGGFYGDFRAHHRTTPPTTYDPNRYAGCRARWTTPPAGRCGCPKRRLRPARGFTVTLLLRSLSALRAACARNCAGGARSGRGRGARRDASLSGVCRGRFAADGQPLRLRVERLADRGAAPMVACSVCAIPSKPLDVPTAMEVKGNTIRLTFARALDAKTITSQPTTTAAHGGTTAGAPITARSAGNHPTRTAEGPRRCRRFAAAKLLADGRTVELTFDALEAGHANASGLQRESPPTASRRRRLGLPDDPQHREVIQELRVSFEASARCAAARPSGSVGGASAPRTSRPTSAGTRPTAPARLGRCR